MSQDNHYKAIIFDLFGTLVNTFPSSMHNLVLKEMSYVLGVKSTDFAKVFDRDMRHNREIGKYSTIEENILQACKLLGKDPSQYSINISKKCRFDFIKKTLIPRKNTTKVLKLIRSKGYMIGLISDCPPEVPILWSNTPLKKLIDAKIFSCEVGIKKPDQRIYQTMCYKLKVKPEECLYVGDGDSSELDGALRIGMEPILIRVRGEENQDIDRPQLGSWRGEKISCLSDVLLYL